MSPPTMAPDDAQRDARSYREGATNDTPPSQIPRPPSGPTPPPGFHATLTSSTTSAEPNGGVAYAPSAPSHSPSPFIYDGAALRAEGSLSAPPPPGFGASPDQRFGAAAATAPARLDLARGLLGRAAGPGARAAPHAQPRDQHARRDRPALLHPAAVIGGGGGGARPDFDHEDHKRRTTSFTNLAAVLGEGLAESMDDSLERQRGDRHQQLSLSQAASGADAPLGQQQSIGKATNRSAATRDASSCLLTASGPNGSDMNNLSRRSQHGATRLIGSSNSNPADMGGYFSSTTGVTVTPARMMASREGPSASSIAEDCTPSPSLTQSSTPQPVYPPSLGPSPVGRGPMGVTLEEPRGLSVGQGEVSATPSVATLPPRTFSTERSSAPASMTHPREVRPFAKHQACAEEYDAGLAAANLTPELKEHHRQRQHSDGVAFLRSSNASQSTKAHLHGTFSPTVSPVPPPPGVALQHGEQLPPGPADLERLAERELFPFLWDIADNGRGGGDTVGPPLSRTPSPAGRTSRGLAILRASGLHVPDVRSTCEAFGALLSFRHEFCRSRGVIFVTYHDLRSAWLSASELAQCLRRMAAPAHERCSGAVVLRSEVKVCYCVALNSSSANDESTILLGNMPQNVDEHDLRHILTSYGAVRSVCADHMDGTGRSFIVEFYDIQDARQALLEIESAQPWGPDVTVMVGTRHPVERKQGQELLGLVSQWRRVAQNQAAAEGDGRPPVPSPLPGYSRANMPQGASPSSSSDSTSPMPQAPDTSVPGSSVVSAPNEHTHQIVSSVQTGTPLPSAPPHPPQPTTQLMVGPNGQYSYVVVNPAPTHPHHINQHPQAVTTPFMQQQIVHGPHGTYVTSIPTHLPVHHHGHQPQYVIHHTAPHTAPHHTHPPPQYHHLPPGTVISSPHFVDGHPHGFTMVPMYTTSVTTTAHTDLSVSSGGSGPQPYAVHGHPCGGARDGARPGGNSGGHRSGTGRSSGSGRDDDLVQLLLDIEAVKSGRDTRTSLMVRNIPNKYTQRMLLAEFAEGGHGPDKIDFFYLPIDFKNKCNRGYAFVNFVDHTDIVPFHHRYNGKGWRVFNSDKICDITYARIQGKAAMMKRFQNSALMEKEDEYKPLVFVSHGANKGKKEDFPASQPIVGLSSLSVIARSAQSPPK